METINFKIRGTAPMLHHNSQLADPLNVHARALKKISAKRKKTDDDYADMARVEMLGGLYWTESAGLHIPGENIEACLIGAAKFKKLGAGFKRSLQVVELTCPMIGTGAPGTPDKIADNPDFRFVKSVKVGTARIMRTRPIFEKWSCEFTVMYDQNQLQREDIIEAAQSAGLMVGLGDWRPRFGKFEVVEAA
jgi:hypothetical protein